MTDGDEADYWGAVRKRAKELDSDGCTCVTQLFQDCCFLHDILWRTGADLDGNPVTPQEANVIFRQCMAKRSRLGRFSPLVWIRYWAVSTVGRRFWLKRDELSQPAAAVLPTDESPECSDDQQ